MYIAAYVYLLRCRPLAGDVHVFCQRLNQMGCVLPSEGTAASVVAASLVAQHGPSAGMLRSTDIECAYNGIKLRLKQLYKTEPAHFLQRLPATPAELVRLNRDFALSLFSREEPPVPCPLHPLALQQVQSRVVMRGGASKKQLGTLAGGLYTLASYPLSGVDRFTLASQRCRPLHTCMPFHTAVSTASHMHDI